MKNKFKCTEDLHVIPEAMKILGGNIEEMFQDIEMDKKFLDKTLNHRKQQQIQKMVLYQTIKLLYNKGNNQQDEEIRTDWEQIFANHTCDKGLISTMYEQLKQLISKHQITLLSKGLFYRPNRHFLKAGI
jgi:hypothetical protein